MEELKQKIKSYQEEIDIFCCNHLVTEEDVRAIFHTMIERDSLVYQSKNEVWNALRSEDRYFDFDNDFVPNYIDDRFDVVFHYNGNREESRLKSIEEKYSVDIDGLYHSSYYNEEDKELDEMTDKFSCYDIEFILWALNKRMGKKVIYKKVHLECSYESYEIYFLVKDKTMSDKEIDESIDIMVKFADDWANGHFEQFQLEGDGVLDDGCIYTIMENELPSKDIENIKEIKEKLASFSGTGRKIIINW